MVPARRQVTFVVRDACCLVDVAVERRFPWAIRSIRQANAFLKPVLPEFTCTGLVLFRSVKIRGSCCGDRAAVESGTGGWPTIRSVWYSFNSVPHHEQAGEPERRDSAFSQINGSRPPHAAPGSYNRTRHPQFPSPPSRGEKVAFRPDEGVVCPTAFNAKPASPSTQPSPPIRLRFSR